ncbi:MAG: type II toxin-antitoxin system RelE/ParE family toxin [Bacteroidales bacterium]|nr:type II toxin-antitoxin system RelE/ParE family toxin [Bacteroidales bacterium]
MVKRIIIWSSRAKQDLFEILDFYYKQNGNKIYSKRLNSKIRKTVRLLSKQSNIGVQTDYLNIRNLIDGDYNIFYEVKLNSIEIITIWDSRQNPDRFNIKD